MGAALALCCLPAGLRAETAIELESCRDAEAKWTAYYAIPAHLRRPEDVPRTAKCWDFEQGVLADSYFGPWTHVYATSTGPLPTSNGTAFANQPTYGDNVRLERVHPAGALRAGLNSIGGNYWNTPVPIGNQGSWWIGTYEDRRGSSNAWNGTQGDGPVGTLLSPTFPINRDYIHFLMSGWCGNLTANTNAAHVRVEVWNNAFQTPPNQWVQAVNVALGSPLKASGSCSELMQRTVFVTDSASGLQGRSARIVVWDGSSGGWGHVNVDHVLHTDELPPDWVRNAHENATGVVGDADNRRNVPVWGFADLHTHPGGRDLNFLGLDYQDGHVFQGETGSIPDLSDFALRSFMSSCNALHYTDGNTSFHQGAKVLLDTLAAGTHHTGGYKGDGTPDFVGWPHWWTRAHQQMYVSWMKRAFDGGQRLMVASRHNHELLGAMMRENSEHAYLSDYGAIRRFAAFMRELAAANGSWMAIASSPSQARSIIRSNRLAVVLATEVDNVGDKCALRFTETTAVNDGSVSGSLCSGCSIWPIRRRSEDMSAACGPTDYAGWAQRIDDLYGLGYRLITPIHQADNELGGAAVYNDLNNFSNLYLNRAQYSVVTSPAYSFKLNYDTAEPVWCQGPSCATLTGVSWKDVGDAGAFVSLVPLAALFLGADAYTPARRGFLNFAYAGVPEGMGHMNARGLTYAGIVALSEMKRRGMVIDVTHMSRRSRDKVLGFGAHRYEAVVGSSFTGHIPDAYCDMTTPACQKSAYPAIASHSALQPLSGGYGKGSEGGLGHDEVLRIRDIGGIVGVGTGDNGDLAGVDEAFALYPAPAPGSLYAATVPNTCAGSSRSWAQAYLYAVRAMRGKGVALGTDFGIETQTLPRFGGPACLARGNVQYAGRNRGGEYVFYRSQGNATTDYEPYALDLAKIERFGDAGTAGGQKMLQSNAVNYAMYEGTAPSHTLWGNWYGDTREAVGYASWIRGGRVGLPPTPYTVAQSIYWLYTPAGVAPLSASVAGNRKFDFNIDGLAHYGMLPDLFQDLRVVGMTPEQLGVVFRSAEDFIKVWEKSCAKSDPAVSAMGCTVE